MSGTPLDTAIFSALVGTVGTAVVGKKVLGALTPKIPTPPAPASATDKAVQDAVEGQKKRMAGETGKQSTVTGGSLLAGQADTTLALKKLLGQ